MLTLKIKAVFIALFTLPLYGYCRVAFESLFSFMGFILPFSAEMTNTVLILSGSVITGILLWFSPFFLWQKVVFTKNLSRRVIYIILTALSFALFYDSVALLLDHPLLSEKSLSLMSTPKSLFLHGFLIILIAPLLEELFFRGHLWKSVTLFEGGEKSALFISSVAWSFHHMQYGWFEQGMLLILGTILGMVRMKYKTLFWPILLHICINSISFLQHLIWLKLL